MQVDNAKGEDFQLNCDRETEGLVQRDHNIKDTKYVMIYFRKEISSQDAAYVFFLLVLQAWFQICTFGKK